jgi:cobalt-zinc-cadmium efflux system outer membrane protein
MRGQIWILLLTAGAVGIAFSRHRRASAQEADLPPPPQRQVLTLNHLEQMALACNPTLAQAAAEIDIAAGEAVQAGFHPNPIVGYAGYQMGAAGRPGQQGVFLEQKLPYGEKLELSVKRGNYETCRRRWQAAEERMRLINRVRIAYYRVLATRRLISLQDLQIDRARRLLAETPRLVETQAIQEADRREAELQIERWTIDREATLSGQRIAWQRLAGLWGAPCMKPAELEDLFETSRADIVCEEVLAYTLARSPELSAARADVARAEVNLEREQIDRHPDSILRTGTQYDTASEKQQVSVEIGFVLPLFDRNQGNIRAAKAQLMRAKAQFAQAEVSLKQRFAEEFSRYQSARRATEIYHDRLLGRARQLFQDRVADIRNKQGSWSDVSDALRTLGEVETAYIKQLLRLRMAEVLLCGMLLNDDTDASDTDNSR